MKKSRSSKSLRDVLFEEIDELRSGNGDKDRAMAVAHLAKQIVNIAKVELDFHREALKHAEAGHKFELGTMELGSSSSASRAAVSTTGQSSRTTEEAAA